MLFIQYSFDRYQTDLSLEAINEWWRFCNLTKMGISGRSSVTICHTVQRGSTGSIVVEKTVRCKLKM